MIYRKRIAFITNFLTPYRLSFYEKLYLHSEYDWMFFHGVKVKDDGRPAFKGELKFPNRPVGYIELKVRNIFIRWQGGVIQQLKEWQPEIVIILGIPSILTNWFALYWARRNDSKTIIWHCGWESQSENKRTLKIKQWLTRQFLGLSDYILVYSSKGARYLTTIMNQPRKMAVCYNGLEIDHLLARENEYRIKAKLLREKHQLEGKKVFLYVGGMMEEKKIPLLLSAFQSMNKNPDEVLWLVGDGPDLDKIKNLVKNKQNGTIKFWGRIIEDVDVLFAAADYFVLPGLGGLALNQALYWGLPCVVSDADGTEDDLVIDGITGYRFIANDKVSLTDALTKCIALREDQRITMGFNGRNLILYQSNVNKMVDMFINTIQEISLK